MAIPIALAVAGETLKFGAKQYLAPALAKLGTSALKNIGVGNIMGLFGKSGNSSAKAAAEQYQYNLALQKQAQQWNEYMYRNRYQMQVEDLEKAGINKLYGLGSAPSVTSGANSVGMPDYVGEAQKNKENMLQAFELARSWSATKAANEKVRQETKTEIFNTQIRALEVIGTQLDNLYKKKQLTWYDKQQIIQLQKDQSEISKNLKQMSYIEEETQIIKRTNEWHKKHPILSQIATGGKELEPATNAFSSSA